VLVLAPVPDWSPRPEEITGVVAAMQRSGSMLVIEPDDGSRNAIGPNPLDPSTAAAAATAGRVQGRTCVDAAREVWW
jgi:NTE family protein